MAAVTIHSDFGVQEEEIHQYFHRSPSVCCAVMGPYARILIFFFLIFSLKAALHFPPSSLSRGTLVLLHFLPLEWYHPSEALDVSPAYLDSSL